jgi:flagellar basal-body rod modification protein FlgD
MSASTSSLINAANTAAAGLTSSSATGTASGVQGSSSIDPLSELTSNFQSFLTLLTTQLQNQDPSAPMDSNQFTSELVAFTGVDAQIQTNASLGQLIQLAQGSTTIQSEQLLGKQVAVTSNQLVLQNGTAALQFTAQSAGTVAIAVYNAAGQQLYDATVNANAGRNTWTWNGQTAGGVTEPDGAYNVAVVGSAAGGGTTALPFTVLGTVTGVQASGSTVDLSLGSLTVPISALGSAAN